MNKREFVFTNEAQEAFGDNFTYRPPAEEAKLIFEAAASDNSLVVDLADQQLRSAGMALALAWVEQGDFSYAAFNDGAFYMAEADEGTEEPDDEENNHINDVLQAAADAFISMGADPANVTSFIDDEDDEAGATLGAFLAEKMADVTMADDEIITQFALGGDLILESMVKTIRGGRVVLKRKKRLGFHAKLSSAQRAGLKKARSKAFTGAARVARRKSMRIRTKMGL
jgi:hypothetical protein